MNKLIKNPLFYFFAVSIFGYFLTFFRLLYSRGAVFDEIFGLAGYFSFGDMIMHLAFVDQPAKVYFASEQACFPPFAYLIYLIINRLLPTNGAPDMTFYRQIPSFLLLYIILMILICGILREQIAKIIGDRKYVFAIWLLMVFSEPFWGSAIERGNSVLLSLLFILGGLIWKDSDSARPYKKEAGLFLFALAASLKIYPAVMGFIYLVEKRFKEAARLVLYGILTFFIPFLFFGKLAGFRQFLVNLTAVDNRQGSIYTVGGCFILLYQKIFHAAVVPESIYTISYILSVLYLMLALVMVILCREYWKKLLFLTSLMVIFVPSSYSYTTVYLAIPFLYFLKDMEATKINRFYAALFGLIFTIMPIPSIRFIQIFDLSFSYGIRYLALAAIIIGILAEKCLSGILSPDTRA